MPNRAGLDHIASHATSYAPPKPSYKALGALALTVGAIGAAWYLFSQSRGKPPHSTTEQPSRESSFTPPPDNSATPLTTALATGTLHPTTSSETRQPVAGPSSSSETERAASSSVTPNLAEQQKKALEFLISYANIVAGDALDEEEKQNLNAILSGNPQLIRRIENLDPYAIIDTPDGTLVNGLTQGVLNPATEVYPNLYAGSISDGLNPDKTINRIINFSNCYDLEGNKGPEGGYHSYKIEDTHEPTKQMEIEFEKGIREAIKGVKKGEKVLVHCVEGKNRTGVACAVIIAHLKEISYDKAWEEFHIARGKRLHAKPTDKYHEMGRALLEKLKTEAKT